MTSLRRALLLASAVMVWQGCSLNDSGLTSDGGPRNDAGTGGLGTDGPVAGAGGSAAGGRGGAGGSASGVAGSVAGASGSTGGNVAGAGGAAGSSVAGVGGSVGGAGGTVAGAAGNVAGAAGSIAGAGGSVGGAGVGGSVAGAGGQGMAGAGGVSGMGGGVAGMGGSVAGMGGRGGAGMAGRGGSGGGGRGGVGGRACMGYPNNARAFIPPTDNRVHCYWPHANLQSYSQARMTCTNEDGHLVTILSEEENLFVVSIAQFSPMYSDTWIGASDGRSGSDARGPGTYTWVTGETWNFNAWATGEPDGACDQPCSGPGCSCDHRGTLVSDGTWSDRYESTTRGFVCEATP